MGRRRRRVIKVVKKKLPSVFSCPSCGEEAVKVVMNRSKRKATVQCAACGLKQEIETSPADQMVDVYCRFTDRFYGVKEPSVPKQTQAPTQMIQEEQVQPETQKGAPEATAETEEASEGVPQSPQEQAEELETTETTAQKTEESASEDSHIEETAV